MAVGQKADLSFLSEYQIQLKNNNLIEIEEETGATSRKGVFAGGDATAGPSTVIQCVAGGHNAARGIHRYLGLAEGHVCDGMQTKLPFLTFDTEGVKIETGLKLDEIPAAQRSIDAEDEIPPKAEEALAEAKRCMNCGCYSIQPSDIAPVLVALGAKIKTTARTLTAEEFCCRELKVDDVLEPGEIITEIEAPVLKGAVMSYDKFRLREAVDWAIVSLASALAVESGKVTEARLVLGGVAPIPVRLNEAEGYLVGKALDEKTIAAAADLVVKQTKPMWENVFKIHEMKVMIERALRRVGEAA
jgi:CO/xanthine dehydrogenase FAD-binding subunit